jgi:hypothetical protein
MDTRQVTGQIFRPDSSPWVEADVWFTLFAGSYTANRHYPKDSFRFKTDADGNFVANLWPNEAGNTSTYWICRLPSGEVFNFSLPVGDTPISIELLRSIGVPPVPPDPNLGAQLSALISEHNSDPEAHLNQGHGNYRGEILPSDLIGPYAIVPHNLNQEIVDVTVFDDEGALALPWAPFDLNRVQINFSGLVPITKTYKILVEV